MFTQITSPSIGKSWQKLLLNIFDHGNDIYDENKKLKELCDVIIILPNNFCLSDNIFESLYNQEMILFMHNNFFEKKPIEKWGYSYGQRFYDYSGINQIEQIITKIKNNLWTKSATISLAYPPKDRKHVPCIFCLDFKVRNNMLNMTAYFRSQDAGKKYCADVICLREIQQLVSDKTEIDLGQMFLISSSMHIYEDDISLAKHVINFKNE